MSFEGKPIKLHHQTKQSCSGEKIYLGYQPFFFSRAFNVGFEIFFHIFCLLKVQG